MNIVHVTYGLPYPPHSGARMRDYHLIRHVAQRHSVTVLSQLETADEQAYLPQMAQVCDRVEAFAPRRRSLPRHVARLTGWVRARRPLATYSYIRDALADRLNHLVTTEAVHLVQIEHSFLAPYIDTLPPSFAGQTALSLHNIGVQQYRRMTEMHTALATRVGYWIKWLLMRNWEVQYAARFDQVIAVSPVDADWLRAANPQLHVSVVENGVDSQVLRPLAPPDGHTLIYVGTMGYWPNADAVLYFADDILPHIQRAVPDVSLFVVGRAPRPEIVKLDSRSNIIVTGHVPDVIPYYQQAQVCVVPLRAGGGTRLKILEAMALGRPVVSSSVGCEGLEVVDGEHLLVADTPTAFAAHVARLLYDRELWSRLTRNARRLVETRYDWAVLGDKLLRVYDAGEIQHEPGY